MSLRHRFLQERPLRGHLLPLVDQAQQLLQGVEPQTLRQDQSIREQLSRQLSAVQGTLDGLLVDRPRRNLIRPVRRELGAD